MSKRIMTVKELTKVLQDVPQDAPVFICIKAVNEGFNEFLYEVDNVETIMWIEEQTKEVCCQVRLAYDEDLHGDE